MRVLMLVSEAPPVKSGISRVAGELTRRLRATGIRLDVLSANEIPRWTFKEFRLSSLAFRWLKIQRVLPRYDILHVHGMVPTFSDVGLVFGRLWLTMTGSPAAIVYTHHSDIDIAGLSLPVTLYNKVHTWLLRFADHVIASTPTYASRLEGTPRPGRVSAVGFGVDAEQFQASAHKSKRFNVLFVGQLRPYKGVDTLLKAWQLVENADLHIVGDGHERTHLEALAQRLGLRSVYFHGSVSEKQLQQFYARAHTLVLPSTRRAEAFGLVLLEGMAAGCVPVSSDLPGVADVVATSGYTFPVGNVRALASVLTELRDNPDKRQELSVRASGRAIATSWDYTAEAYRGIYQQAHLGRQLELTLKGGKNSRRLQNWLAHVTQASGADRASLMLVRPGDNKLSIVASVGMPPEVVATTELRVGERMAGFVAHTGRPMLIRRRKMPGVARIYVKRDSSLTSALILPLVSSGRPVGVLNLARGPERLSFTEADQHWLNNLAMQVSSLLENYMSAQAEVGTIVQHARARMPSKGPGKGNKAFERGNGVSPSQYSVPPDQVGPINNAHMGPPTFALSAPAPPFGAPPDEAPTLSPSIFDHVPAVNLTGTNGQLSEEHTAVQTSQPWEAGMSDSVSAG